MESIISFPSRGNRWGNAKYRGNCSGYVQKTLFEQFHTKEVTDPMAGSFTTRDVARGILRTFATCNTQREFEIANDMLTGICGYSFETLVERIRELDREHHCWESI